MTGGLAPDLAINFTGHAEFQGNGWGNNLYNGKDAFRVYHDVALRSSLLWRPGSSTEVRVSADYEDNRNNIASSTKLAPGTGFPFPGEVNPTKRRDIDSDVQPNQRLKGGGVSANITQDVDFASLVSITAYRRSRYFLQFDGDATNVPLVGIDIGQNDHQLSQELQLASKPGSPIKWVIGAFYFDATSAFAPNAVNIFGLLRPNTPLGPVTGSIIDDKLGVRSIAGYAQATAPIFDATNLTLGFRYTNERKNLTDIRSLTQFLALPAPVAVPPVPNKSITYNRPTWRASLDHRFSPEVLVYASYNRGFKSGGYNGQTPADAPFKPEKIDAYEAGAKTDLFDRHLRIDGSVFYYDYSNIQVSRFINSQISYYNGASAHVYGLDVDYEARLTRHFSLTGGLTLLHDRFTSFPNAAISTQVPFGIITTIGSAKGNRLPLTPDFSGTITASYHTPLNFGELALDASYTYNRGYYTQPDNILRQPSYDLLSAGATVTLHNGLSARVFARNLLNAAIFNTLAAGSFDSNASYQAPRTYGITLGAKF